MNILFTCVGRRTYLLNYFKEQLTEADRIVATDMQNSAPALSAADYVEIVPSVYSPDYLNVILGICKKYTVNLLISLNDLELPILSKNRMKFEQVGVFLLVSSPRVIDICSDKLLTANYLLSLGLKTPMTYDSYTSAQEAIRLGNLHFPLVLKPRWGSGSIGIEYVNDLDEMELCYKLLLKKIKKSILANISDDNNPILIQEKIEGEEYGLDIMNDLRGNHIAVSVKRKLSMRAGETDKATTVDNSALRLIGSTIGENLKHIGNLDCDVLEHNGVYYVLEMNPRFGGGYPFSHEAGVNLPRAIIEWFKGGEVDPKLLIPNYNKTFAKCDYLVER